VGLHNSIPEQLPLTGYNPAFPATSAKGDRLAFVEATEDRDIWRINGPAGQERFGGISTVGTRLISSTRMDTNPQYSPDGARIAFTSSRSGTLQIWICDSDGSNPVQLTHFIDADAGTPRWSPDGRYIAFDLFQTGTESNSDIYVISAQGGPVRCITPEKSTEDMPSWSHDGKWIYFESDRSGVFEIWKVPFTGGTAVQITKNGAAEAFESQDGQFVYYTKWQQRGLWRTSVQNRSQETLVLNIGSPYLLSLYDKGACLVDLEPAAGPTIKCLDFESNRIRTICTLPKGQSINESGPSLSVSRDGRWILYVGIDRKESDIMIVDRFR
jgi:Tol biopolymer transport system component